jgi:osmotically inducible lipoprotein OsmB
VELVRSIQRFLGNSTPQEARTRKMPRYMRWTILAIVLILPSACGTTPGCRAASTGALGAASGAAIGAIAGAPGLGALVGGVTGAAGGAATSPRVAYAGPSPFCY